MTPQRLRAGLADFGAVDAMFAGVAVAYTTIGLVAASEGMYAIAFVCFCLAVFEASFIGGGVP